jgi:hypothetical protein
MAIGRFSDAQFCLSSLNNEASKDFTLLKDFDRKHAGYLCFIGSVCLGTENVNKLRVRFHSSLGGCYAEENSHEEPRKIKGATTLPTHPYKTTDP